MHGVVLFARQQFVKLLSQSINYSSIPIQYCYSLTVTTINSHTTHNTVATATAVTTAVTILLLFSLCPTYSHSVPVDHPVKHHQSSLFSSFPTTLSASSSFSFVSFALTSFSSSYPSFWFVSQSSSSSSSCPSQLSLSYNPDFEFDSETIGTSTSE